MDHFFELIGKLPFAILIFFITVRLFGLKEMAQATAVEFGFAVMAISIVWDMSISKEYQLWQIPIVLLIMYCMVWLVDWLTSRSRLAEYLILGEPRVLIKDGKINEDVLKAERISMAELESKMRLRGVFDFEDVEIAYLEVSGEISVKIRERI